MTHEFKNFKLSRRLTRKFFARDAQRVARDLLGKRLVRKLDDGKAMGGLIVETEAYVGVEDLASHAAGGRRTKRNEVMYGKAGLAYVYFTYGMHWLFNIVTSRKDEPQAVLVRGLDIVRGPARLTKALQIDGRLNGEDIITSKRLWVEDGGIRVNPGNVFKTPRIGVGYAKEWKDILV